MIVERIAVDGRGGFGVGFGACSWDMTAELREYNVDSGFDNGLTKSGSPSRVLLLMFWLFSGAFPAPEDKSC